MTAPDTSNHIDCGTPRPCWGCRQPTTWIELSFEAALCPGPCTDAKWREYVAAERKAGAP